MRYSHPRLAIIFFTALVAVTCFPEAAHALKRYSCSGRIQFRPCDQPYATGSKKVEVAPPRYAPPELDESFELPYAKVVSSSFESLPPNQGIWRGVVEGNGTIHLKLLIKRGGTVESSRYMGNVDLKGKSTTFAFKSAQPNTAGWSWDIVAYNG